MSFLYAVIVFMFLNASVISAETTDPPALKSDCTYCIHDKDIDVIDISTAINASDEFCGCFKNSDPPYCGFLNAINSTEHVLLRNYCETIIIPINKKLSNNKGTCNTSPPGLIIKKGDTASSDPDVTTNATLPTASGHNETGSSVHDDASNITLAVVIADNKTESTVPASPVVTYGRNNHTDSTSLSTDDIPSTLIAGNDTDGTSNETLPHTGGGRDNTTDGVTTDVVPTDVVPTDVVPTDGVTTDAVPTDGMKDTDVTSNKTVMTTEVPTDNINATVTALNNVTDSTKSPDLDADKSSNSSHTTSSGDKSDKKDDTDDTSTPDHLKRSANSSDDKNYSLGAILTAIFLSFGAGILVAVLAKMLYNRYRKDSYVLPPDQRMQDM